MSYSISKITFPKNTKKNWQKYINIAIRDLKKTSIKIEAGNWHLNCKQIQDLIKIIGQRNLEIDSLESTNIKTIVSASSLGLNALFRMEEKLLNLEGSPKSFPSFSQGESEVLFHQGTLRSGERLETTNDLLILGDVNPGAMALAGGNIMIWGKLLGVAHAGKEGNHHSKITALQLRPVQLRIANKIARGPSEKPEEGLTEEARIEGDSIVIKPARIGKAFF